jgi:hypothetical protein
LYFITLSCARMLCVAMSLGSDAEEEEDEEEGADAETDVASVLDGRNKRLRPRLLLLGKLPSIS